jgi:hypothetical protein
MSMAHWLKRVQPQGNGTLQEVAYVMLDTAFVLDYAEEISGGGDFPDDASLDWTEPADYDAEFTEDDGFDPEAVLASLRWIERTAEKATKENRGFWERSEKRTWRPAGPLPFSPEALSQACQHDLQRMIRLCEDARAAGDLVLHVLVP